MGAGASIDDVDDLKKEYEKVKPNLTEEQKTSLEDTYDSVKTKGEFLIIGKCKQTYAKLGIEGADPAFAPKARKVDSKPAAAPSAEAPVVQGAASAGVTRFELKDLPLIVAEAWKEGLTPLILDTTPDHKVDTFYHYASVMVLDAKHSSIGVSLQGADLGETLDKMRKTVVAAMKRDGVPLVVSMQQSAVDFKGKFNGDETFPLALFDKGGRDFINVGNEDGVVDKPATNKLFRDEDTVETANIAVCGKDFGVVVTSWFAGEDVVGDDSFIFQPDFGLPDKSKFKILELTHPHG